MTDFYVGLVTFICCFAFMYLSAFAYFKISNLVRFIRLRGDDLKRFQTWRNLPESNEGKSQAVQIENLKNKLWSKHIEMARVNDELRTKLDIAETKVGALQEKLKFTEGTSVARLEAIFEQGEKLKILHTENQNLQHQLARKLEEQKNDHSYGLLVQHRFVEE